ncbi:MAG TPA: SMC-Scp complex subunit ScpB [Acidobacteriaceae bacterium]|jgi:segregation and condensation protein B|nr:SMC-Scp complex subunit ScpB [Acidobacteriaceae bacterium]
MSLKAKLEAVIYAAEEPVTLAQLASLFAEDAFAWRAEQEDAQRKLALTVATAAEADGEPKIDPGTESVLADSANELADLAVLVEQDAESQAGGAEVQEFETVAPETAATETLGPDSEATAAPAVAVASQEEAELEARRLQRIREREVREILRTVLDELIADYAGDARGLEIREIAGGFRLGTKPEMHDSVRAFVKSLKPPLKLSLPALETLAVIAYKQPVTAPEVGEIRGVDSAGVLGSLLSRKLVATAGRKQVIGRPILYKTTREFLLRFGLKDLNELPSMEEFEKMAALELSEDADEEPGDSLLNSGVSAQSGELFPDANSGKSEEQDEPEQTAETSDVEAPKEAVSTPAAEASEEAAEAQAPVERQAAEEVEVEQ